MKSEGQQSQAGHGVRLLEVPAMQVRALGAGKICTVTHPGRSSPRPSNRPRGNTTGMLAGLSSKH